MTSPLFDQTVTGRVTHANEKGIRLDVSDGWLNASKFAVGLVLPSKGEHVAVTLDKGGFIRAVTTADGAAQLPVRGGSDHPSTATKDRTITRLAVLKAAVQRAEGRPDVSTADVLRIAEAFERWVNRPYDGAELTDAF